MSTEGLNRGRGERQRRCGNDSVGVKTVLAGYAVTIDVEGDPRPPRETIRVSHRLNSNTSRKTITETSVAAQCLLDDFSFEVSLAMESDVSVVGPAHSLLWRPGYFCFRPHMCHTVGAPGQHLEKDGESVAFLSVGDLNSNSLIGEDTLDKNHLSVDPADAPSAVDNLANLKG
jgi:hypothetical protein